MGSGQTTFASVAAVQIDLMTGASSWDDAAELARLLEGAGFSGMLYTETTQVPWMQIAAAATAAPNLYFTTGIAVAFPRSPMLSAAMAYEIAANTGGRFRLGLGSQVKAHVTRRYGSDFDRPAARLRDYVLAVKACFRAFNREERLQHDGEFYQLNLLPPDWAPRPHDHPMPVDISAVGPLMSRVAGEVAELLIDELRKIAAGLLARERKDHTLQPTALVNELYLRLLDRKQVSWNDRSHFLSFAARTVRRILVDHARHRGAGKRHYRGQCR